MSIHADGDIELSGESNIGVYSSSEWAERAFCKQCGSNLYYRLLPGAHSPSGEYIVTVGSLDEPGALQFDHEVYVDHKPDWYAFRDESARQQLTEADILKLYGGG